MCGARQHVAGRERLRTEHAPRGALRRLDPAGPVGAAAPPVRLGLPLALQLDEDHQLWSSSRWASGSADLGPRTISSPPSARTSRPLPLAVSVLVMLPLLGAGPLGLGLDAGLVPLAGEVLRNALFGVGLTTSYSLLRVARQRSARAAAEG